jgi:lysophospholipase L1-like esterase
MTRRTSIAPLSITKTTRQFLFLLSLCSALSACQHPTHEVQLQGLVIESQPLANALVTVRDAQGEIRQTTTDHHGRYTLSAQGLTPPLRLSAVAGGNAADCLQNATLRPICMAAVVEHLPGTTTIANINPLTDRIVSDTAVAHGFMGPQQWVDETTLQSFDSNLLLQARREMQTGFAHALQVAGVTNIESFDPAGYPLHENPQLMELLGLLNHNRNYDNNSGSVGHTSLSDPGFRPLVGLLNSGAYEVFDLLRARQEAEAIRTAATRIFIVGDSTSAVYEQLRYPRMGWGQMLEAQFKADANIKVVVGSRAGRSSRDFYNGRWFAQMENLIQPGDYVFINHGHNDQNCDADRALRGAADVKNLCTYPNNAQGQPQFPTGKPELSFYYSLERYITIAQQRGAIPILFTPTARIKNAKGEQALPVVHSHFIQHKPNSNYAFVGDYTQTIRDLARAKQLPLIDLEAASIAFANKVGEPGWRNYWLVVDKSVNPFYAETVAGSTQLPDGTHFQKNGAEAMAKLTADLIKKDPALSQLAQRLRIQ